MKCTEIKELLVAYVEGLLEDSEKQAVEKHLKDCSACRAELQELKGLHDRLETNGKALAQSNLEKDVMNQVIREQKVRLKAAEKAAESLKIRRTIMKSPMTKIAVAAVIIIAVLIGINPFGDNVTFAQVVEPILNAKTVIFDLVLGDDDTGIVSHEVVVGSLMRRTMSNMPNMTMVIDPDNAQLLALDNEAKTAVYVDIAGDLGDNHRSYIKFVRQIITQLQENQVEQLGEEVIDGKKAVVFVGKSQNEAVKIWADPETAHPIRIEAQIGQEFTFTMKNFEFDADVDESLVSMDVPEGYTLKKTDIALGNATEEDFVESLRIWAEIIGEGTFPEAIGSQNVVKEMPTLVQKVTSMQVSEEKGTQIGMSFAKGMVFHQMLDNGGRDWNYTGAGVKLGDADTPVFWYQPQGSDTYRVIYGDLSVKDVAPEDLPK
jgi:outer membrane lipoprotein-sorting protein